MQSTTLIDTRSAAEIFGVTPSTVTRWVQAGKLDPAYQGNGVILFDREYVESVAAQA